MKYTFTAIFIAFAAIMSGQSLDKFSQDSVLYLTDEQEAFMIDKETKFLFKTGPIGIERKLSQAFSINAVFQPRYSGRDGLRGKAGVEIRYYYKMPRLIREGKQANNLSSEYFSAGLGYDGDLALKNPFILKSLDYSLTWGSQKRFLNYGYFDYGIKLGYEDYVYDLSVYGFSTFEAKSIRLSTKTAVGFAFGKNYKIDDVIKCPIFKCHLDRKTAFKLNFNKVFDIAYGTTNKIDKYRLTATLNPNISYEYKLGSSAFSIDQDLDILIGFSTRISKLNPKAGISQYSLGYTVGLRHYFQLNSNLRKGKSGNNLSGVYWFASGSFQYGDSKLPALDEDINIQIGKHKYLDVHCGIGFQKTMLNDFYYDFQGGVQLKRFQEGIIGDRDSHYSDLYINFKVGKLF